MAVVPTLYCLNNLFSYVVKQFVLLSHITQRERFSACLSSEWQMVLLWRDVSSLVWFGASLAGISGIAATDQLLGQKVGIALTFC